MTTKTILRLSRKFFKEFYKNSELFIGRSNGYSKIKRFREVADKFGKLFLQKFNPACDHDQFSELVCRMIDSNLFSRLPNDYRCEESEDIKKFIKDYNTVCAKYTHAKYEKISQNKYFRVVLMTFIKCGGLDMLNMNSMDAERTMMYQQILADFELKYSS